MVNKIDNTTSSNWWTPTSAIQWVGNRISAVGNMIVGALGIGGFAVRTIFLCWDKLERTASLQGLKNSILYTFLGVRRFFHYGKSDSSLTQLSAMLGNTIKAVYSASNLSLENAKTLFKDANVSRFLVSQITFSEKEKKQSIELTERPRRK